MSHDDLSPDDPDVDAYDRSMELRSFLKNFRLDDDFDPYRVRRFPTQDRHKELDSVTFRMPTLMRQLIDKIHGNGHRFANRSEYMNHYAAIGLMVEARLSDEEDAIRALFDPVVGQLELESVLADQAALDKIIQLATYNLTNTDRTIREKARAELVRAKRICERHDDTTRLILIDQALGRQP